MDRKIKSKTVKRLVRLRLEKSLKAKLKERDKKIKEDQKELRYHLYRDKPKVKADEIIYLSDNYDTPYMFVEGHTLWWGLKRSWLGFKIGKVKGEDGGDMEEQRRQRECAVKIQDLQSLLKLPVEDFSRIGVTKDKDI